MYLEKVTFASIMLHKTECKLSHFLFLKQNKTKPKQLLTSKPHMAYVTSSALQKSHCLGLWISLAGVVFTS